MAGRRSFFRWLAVEGIATVEQAQGKPQLRLAELPLLARESLEQIMPMVRPDIRIVPGERDVVAETPGRKKHVCLFPREPADSNACFIFNRFNGQTTIRQISADLAAARGCAYDESFGLVRDLFLRMVGEAVCVPSNPIRT